MTKNEVTEFIRTIKASTVGFSVDPERASGAWFKILGQYTKREAWEAVEHILTHTDSAPTAHSIKQRIGNMRYRERKEHEVSQGEEWRRSSDESFRGISGRNRSEQIIFVCAQQAAKHWIGGEHDNDFFNSRLLDARKLGHEFEGVDYSQVRVSAGYDCGWFSKIAMEAAR